MYKMFDFIINLDPLSHFNVVFHQFPDLDIVRNLVFLAFNLSKTTVKFISSQVVKLIIIITKNHKTL